ncbi:MAG: S46 family peptidase [Sphingomonadaceae bacterium]|nr:S46 family peptidase [Sphingomonadaceae bacterium]
MRLLAPPLVALAFVLAGPARAAEGMWLPSQAPQLAAELRRAGLRLPPERLADLASAPLSAVVSLGGCSGSFVSPEGLVATNHHCVLGSLQFNATPARNLLRDGFLARTRAEELPAAPGTRVFVLEALEDVTAGMTAGITPRLVGAERIQRLEANRKALVAACETSPGVRCEVRPYFGGRQYWRQRMLEILDVRLVYAPADGIGNFGGDVDNWQWPRHTGDFAFYRAYVGPDGRPAPFAATNVPYRPRAFLKVARGDLKEGDFVVVAGFPGLTERLRTAAEAEGWFGRILPRQQRMLADFSALIDREARTEAERIAYAAIKAGADNIAKKIAGQLEMAHRLDLVARKRQAEARLKEWAAGSRHRRPHAMALANFDALTPQALAAEEARLVHQVLQRAQLLQAARTLYRWANERLRPDADREPGFQDRDRQAIVDRLSLVDRRYVPRIDRAILEQALAEVATLPEAQRNTALEAKIAEIGLDRLYAETRLADRAERLAWLDRPVADFMASDDPFIQLAVAAHAQDLALEARRKELDGRIDAARTARMEAVMAHAAAEGRRLYPDANGSLRFTFGHVAGRPERQDGAWAAFTTGPEILAKDRGAEPFASPPALLTALRAGDWACCASPTLGTLPVNFLSSTDITNGNSGSAVLDAHGELVGLAFDGTIEGMLSDWWFDEALTRTIAVDARYLRFVLEKVEGARELLEELGLAQPARRASASSRSSATPTTVKGTARITPSGPMSRPKATSEKMVSAGGRSASRL